MSQEAQPTPPEIKNEIRCPICRNEFPELVQEHAASCPVCKMKAPPQKIAEDVMITINWQDLRILANWAGCWQRAAMPNNAPAIAHMEKICEQVEKVKPKGGLPLFPEG